MARIVMIPRQHPEYWIAKTERTLRSLEGTTKTTGKGFSLRGSEHIGQLQSQVFPRAQGSLNGDGVGK